MALASLCFAAMNTLASDAGRRGLPWQASAAARAVLGLLVALGIALAQGVPLRVRDGRTLALRCLAGTLGMLGTFFSLRHMPLADATALLNTTPLFIALAAWYELGEAPGRRVLAALLVALLAIGLLERPTLGAGHLVGLAALGAACSSAVAMVALRRLGHEPAATVVVYFTAFAAVITAALLGARCATEGCALPDRVVTLELLGIGVTATLGQLAMTRAYALDRAARVGAAGWLQLVLNLAADRVVQGRRAPPSTLAGVALMLLVGVLLTWDALRGEAAQPAPER